MEGFSRVGICPCATVLRQCTSQGMGMSGRVAHHLAGWLPQGAWGGWAFWVWNSHPCWGRHQEMILCCSDWTLAASGMYIERQRLDLGLLRMPTVLLLLTCTGLPAFDFIS